MKSTLLIALLLAGTPPGLRALTPTLNFEDAQALTAAGDGIQLGSHAAPRLADWDDDGVLDLLVADGGGHVWIFQQHQPANSTDYLPGVQVSASGSAVRVGDGYTGACWADFNGDGKPDLIAAGNDHRVRYYPNAGPREAPEFHEMVIVPGPSGEFELPSDVGGRIEIADWDGDTRPDLLTGDFNGYITWYRNTGTTGTPVFGAPGIRLTRGGTEIHEPYNTHPRVCDLNQDGLPDLAFGINWGYVKVLINTTGHGATDFAVDYLLRDVTGTSLNIRSLNGDDTIPDFADLDGDGVLDLISGGFNGKLFVMRGISHATTIQSIESIMAAHVAELGAALDASSVLRDQLFGLHRSLRDLMVNLLPASDRQETRDWYEDHIQRYPQYLTRRRLNQTADAYVPHLAGQVWVNLLESMPDTPAHRVATARAAGFTGTYSNLLVDLGILYVDNNRSSAASQTALYDIAASIPAPLQIVECVTQQDYLKTGTGGGMSIESRAGVNLFAQVGDYSEGFPPDVPQTLIDGFSVVVAHELNHNVEVAARTIYPWYDDRKHDLIEQAAPPHLVFRDHVADRFGLDLPATQARFLEHDLWDGVAEHWNAAYNAYWTTGPGAGFDRHWLRDNLRFCIDAPQEAFATLSNQYFTSSERMLELAIARWEQGIPSGINQFLWMADVYALGTEQTYFYRVNTSAEVTRSGVSLQRDAFGHIRALDTATTHYAFEIDGEGNVLGMNVNAKPVVANPIADPPSVAYGSPFNFQFAADSFADPDHDPLSYAASGVPAGIVFQEATRTFSGTATEAGAFPVTVLAIDGRTPELSAASTFVLTFTPAALSVTAVSESKTYGSSDPPLRFVVSGLQFDDAPDSVLTGGLSRVSGETVSGSPYAIQPGSLTANHNYTIQFTEGAFSIGPAPLSITGDHLAKPFGAADPQFSSTFAGFVNEETPDVLEGILVFRRAPGEEVGEYVITLDGLSSSNYTITLHPGALTIVPTPAPVMLPMIGAGTGRVLISWSAVSKVTYRVQYQSNLDGAWSDLIPDIPATNDIASTTDQPGGEGQRFYRAIVPLRPPTE